MKFTFELSITKHVTQENNPFKMTHTIYESDNVQAKDQQLNKTIKIKKKRSKHKHNQIL